MFSEDMDFKDVFGGPPRRFSMQEVRARYSFGETVESAEEKGSSPWSALAEKPVFGEDQTTPRRRRHGGNFFDDIFKGGGGEAYSSPRRSDRDRDSVFGSNPGSRIMSPARPLPPKSDPLATSLPAHLSLPAKLTKSAMDLPTFGAHNHGQHKVDGLNSPPSSSPLSRYSNQAIGAVDEMRNEAQPVPRQSPLSYEASLIIVEDSPSTVMSSDEKDSIEKSKKDAGNVSNQFHFSIYKWAGRGLPMLMPLAIGSDLKSMDSNRRMESKLSTVKKQCSLAREPQFLSVEQDLRIKELQKAVNEFSELNNVKEAQVKSLDKSDHVRENIEKQVPVKETEYLKSSGMKKPLHVFLDEMKNVKEKEGEGKIDLKNAEVGKSSLKGAAKNLGGSEWKSVSKGKVKEFVEIFNQEVDDSERNWNFRWRNVGSDQKETEASSYAAAKDEEEQVNLPNVEKKTHVSFKVDENLNSDEARRYSPKKIPDYTSDRSANSKKIFSSETLHADSKLSVENSDDPSEDNFQVEEISDAHENVTQSESEDTKAIDAKIWQWSVGKKGNIRSLLSTLQYVLWVESGWKAVPLVDLIEANSVKRAYQKALLRLHPDKLQQKGAPFHHKYTAEKVFDILQEAWDHFNTCSLTV